MRIKVHDTRKAFAKDQIIPQNVLDVYNIVTFDDYIQERVRESFKYISKAHPRFILIRRISHDKVKISVHTPFSGHERFWSRVYTRLDD